MKERPPSRESAMAISGPDTACMLAETNGRFSKKEDSLPFLNLATGAAIEVFFTR
jgi:hypothetical protein